jgi:hypothetical protein
MDGYAHIGFRDRRIWPQEPANKGVQVRGERQGERNRSSSHRFGGPPCQVGERLPRAFLERPSHHTPRSKPPAPCARRRATKQRQWGDLAALHDTSTAEMMRRLAEEEDAAGQTPAPGRSGLPRPTVGAAASRLPRSRQPRDPFAQRPVRGGRRARFLVARIRRSMAVPCPEGLQITSLGPSSRPGPKRSVAQPPFAQPAVPASTPSRSL